MNKIFEEIKASNPSSKMCCFAQAQLGKFSMLGGVGVLPAAESWTVPSWNGRLFQGLRSKYIVTDISLKEPKDLKRCIRFYSCTPTFKLKSECLQGSLKELPQPALWPYPLLVLGWPQY